MASVRATVAIATSYIEYTGNLAARRVLMQEVPPPGEWGVFASDARRTKYVAPAYRSLQQDGPYRAFSRRHHLEHAAYALRRIKRISLGRFRAFKELNIDKGAVNVTRIGIKMRTRA